MFKMRKSKLVAVCSVDSSSHDDIPAKYSIKSFKLESCKSSWHIKVPINDHNIVLHEMYADVYNQDFTSCQKVNFLTLCCNSNVDVSTIKLSYEEYQHVKCVEFTGYIGSMKVAFELLHKFPNVKEVIFVLTDDNVKSENEEYLNYRNEDGFVTKALTVEKLAISQNYKDCEQRSRDIQEEENIWRLDEILFLSRLCIPNIQKIETKLLGNGRNYEKVRSFIDCMPFLKKNHSVEISNGSLTVTNSATANRTAIEFAPPSPAPSTVTMRSSNATSIPTTFNPLQPHPNIEQEVRDVVTQAADESNLYPYVDRSSNLTHNETHGSRPQADLLTRYEEVAVGNCQLPHESTVTSTSSSSDSNNPGIISAQPAAQQNSFLGSSAVYTSTTHSMALGMRNNAERTHQKEKGRHSDTTHGPFELQDNSSKRLRTGFSSNLDDDSRLMTARNPSPPPPPSLSSLPATCAKRRTEGSSLDPRIKSLEVQPNSMNSGGKVPESGSNDWNNLVQNFLCDPRTRNGGRERQSHNSRTVSRSRSRSRSTSRYQRCESPESSWRSHRSGSPSHRMSGRNRGSPAVTQSLPIDGNNRHYRQTYPDYVRNYDEHYNQRGHHNFRGRVRGRGRSRNRRPRRGQNYMS
ncbi:unnamed protein product [Orchesella dallaii]|uniref:Uncharacterized protein n=1 Tax=Orchesella dallaii TaxID=48710 RepID=A0ABP1RKP8_9HEXA